MFEKFPQWLRLTWNTKENETPFCLIVFWKRQKTGNIGKKHLTMFLCGEMPLCGTVHCFSHSLASLPHGDKRTKSPLLKSVILSVPAILSGLYSLFPSIRKASEPQDVYFVNNIAIICLLLLSCPRLKILSWVSALTRKQIWNESLLLWCNGEVALSLLLYRHRGELQVWALWQGFCLQVLPWQAPQVHSLRGPRGPQISLSSL